MIRSVPNQTIAVRICEEHAETIRLRVHCVRLFAILRDLNVERWGSTLDFPRNLKIDLLVPFLEGDRENRSGNGIDPHANIAQLVRERILGSRDNTGRTLESCA